MSKKYKVGEKVFTLYAAQNKISISLATIKNVQSYTAEREFYELDNCKVVLQNEIFTCLDSITEAVTNKLIEMNFEKFKNE